MKSLNEKLKSNHDVNIFMTTLSDELGHLKNHVKYPANRKQVTEACNNMMDVPAADREWFVKALPEGTYKSADEVVSAILKKV